MDLQLNGRTALVLGGSAGLGRATAEALASEGVATALIARDEGRLRAVADEISTLSGVPSFGFAADIADFNRMSQAIDEAQRELGPIDILINNTGGPPPSRVLGVASQTWRAQFEAMVLSVIGITDRLVPAMRERKWGRVLTIASSVVVEPASTLGMSNTLRSALVGWSKTLAGEVAHDGITVNVLLPGLIATARTRQLDRLAGERSSRLDSEIAAERALSIPVGRYGEVEEFGSVAAFLASPKASYVTGSMIRVDGGSLRSV
ncbi:MAG: SDR family oxidoreductase [Pseudomonas sp.]|nr:SDR family oxidoreductase [Pseudomonas sp.]